MGFRALDQIQSQTEGVVRPLVAIRRIIEDEEIMVFFGFSYEGGSFSSNYPRANSALVSRCSKSTCRIRSQAWIIFGLLKE